MTHARPRAHPDAAETPDEGAYPCELARLTGDRVHAFASPDRMGVLARLHGLAARAPHEATVLQLGTGDGTNLLSLASLFPRARFVGLDDSEAALAQATQAAHALALGNVRFAHFTPDAELARACELTRVDYLIALDLAAQVGRAHAVHPDRDIAETRRALLAQVARLLAPGGTAVIGFDTEPGDMDFAPLRALMRFHVRNVADPTRAIAQARQIARWHVERFARLRGEGRAGLLRRLLADLERTSDSQLLAILRDELDKPLSLGAFSEALDAVGLRWLTNAQRSEPRQADLPERLWDLARAARPALASDTLLRQQLLDRFLMTRRRTSLVCGAAEPVARTASPDAFRAFWIGGRVARHKLLAGTGPRVVSSAAGDVTLSDAATQLLLRLSEHLPAAVPVDDLLARCATLSPEEALGAIAELWRADVIELSLAPPDLAHAPPELPRTGALQRLRARAAIGTSDIVGGSLWHREWKLDAAENAALALMDGTMPAVHFEPEVMRKLVHKGFVASKAASVSDSPATPWRSRG